MMRKKGIFILSLSLVFLFGFQTAFCQAQKKLRTIVVDAGHGGSDAGAVGQYENSLKSKEKDVTLAISMKLVAELKKRMPEVKIVPTRTSDIYQSPREKADIANQNKGDLFLCIHADSRTLQTGKREIGSRTVTKYKVTYTGKGKSRRKHSTPYEVAEPIYEYYKIPTTANGTTVYIFAAHKTSDKLKAITKNEEDFEIETGAADSSFNNFDFNSPEGRAIAQVYAKRYQLKSDLIATYVNDEVEKTGHVALGVNQRQTGIWVLQATNMPAILVETGYINNYDDERYLNSEKGQQELAVAITNAVLRYRDQFEGNKTVSK